MKLIYKEYYFAFRAFDFLHDGLETFFKLTAVFSTSNQQSKVKLRDFLITQ